MQIRQHIIGAVKKERRSGDMAKMAKFRPGNGHRVEEFGGGNAPANTRHLWLVDYTTLIAEIRERLLIQS